MSALKTLLTAAALGRHRLQPGARPAGLGRRRTRRRSGAPSPAGGRSTAPDVAAAQEQLDPLQWVIPALTGALVGLSSYAGEQQRPSRSCAASRRRARPSDPRGRPALRCSAQRGEAAGQLVEGLAQVRSPSAERSSASHASNAVVAAARVLAADQPGHQVGVLRPRCGRRRTAATTRSTSA